MDFHHSHGGNDYYMLDFYHQLQVCCAWAKQKERVVTGTVGVSARLVMFIEHLFSLNDLDLEVT